jgi:hypothetical protein
MSDCDSILYGSLKDWKCNLPKGHPGHHEADHMLERMGLPGPGLKKCLRYTVWTDEDSEHTLAYKFKVLMMR